MERGHERPVDGVPDARGLGRERALAGDERDLHAEELVELEPVRGDTTRRASSSGRWMSRYARVRSTSPCSARMPGVERVGEARAPSCARGTIATARRSCQVCTSAFPDCG